jgi:AcrR family transcriptional regulator
VSIHKRKYELRARAERQRQTRDRVVAATVALHTEVGPARTTVADIARRAGVQRLTVYNLFPEWRELFAACQQRFLTDAPPPNLALSDDTRPLDGLRAALLRLYTWYRATSPMERHVHTDRHLIPALDQLMAQTIDVRLADVAETYAVAIGGRPVSLRLRAAVRLALDFWTWERLAHCGLDDEVSAALMVDAAEAAAGDLRRRRRPMQKAPIHRHRRRRPTPH